MALLLSCTSACAWFSAAVAFHQLKDENRWAWHRSGQWWKEIGACWWSLASLEWEGLGEALGIRNQKPWQVCMAAIGTTLGPPTSFSL